MANSGQIFVPQITITGSTSPGAGSPWKAPDQWDSINIGGTGYGWAYAQYNPQLAGSKVRVVGAKRKYKYEVKLPQGADGGVSVYRGVKLSPFDILFYIVTDPQYVYFTTYMLPVLKFSGLKLATNPSLVQAQGVFHPILNSLDILAMVVEEIGGIDPKEDGPNEFICKVRCIEYLPPPNENTTLTPTGINNGNAAKTGAATGSQPTTAAANRTTSLNNIIAAGASGG